MKVQQHDLPRCERAEVVARKRLPSVLLANAVTTATTA